MKEVANLTITRRQAEILHGSMADAEFYPFSAEDQDNCRAIKHNVEKLQKAQGWKVGSGHG